jgi:hypothetical protein
MKRGLWIFFNPDRPDQQFGCKSFVDLNYWIILRGLFFFSYVNTNRTSKIYPANCYFCEFSELSLLLRFHEAFELATWA